MTSTGRHENWKPLRTWTRPITPTWRRWSAITMTTSLGPCSSFISPKGCWHNRKRVPVRFTNHVDSCWRCDPDWEKNRKKLAHCAPGFARGNTSGKDGEFYVVTDLIDNAADPKPGTLRHAATQAGPHWMTFKGSMTIKLQQKLIVTSDKTIDARGANVEVCNGAGITIQFAKNIIIHGLQIHHIIPAKGG
ncbi:hypothetical protein V6Z11_D05G336600 [Gossypium hirsutum]